MPDPIAPAALASSPPDSQLHDFIHVVYASALRQTRDPHLAQDITQSVFVVLAQKRRDGHPPPDRYLAAWLLKVTGYAVQQVRRTTIRQHRREIQVSLQKSEAAMETPADNSHLLATLDDVLLRLRPSDRELLIRRYFRDQPIAQIGQTLGLSENTAGRRIARALQKLRAQFLRRGIDSPADSLGAFLAAQTLTHAPQSVILATTTAMSSLAANPLTTALLNKLLLIKLQQVALFCLAITALALPLGWIAFSPSHASQTAATAPARVPVTVPSASPTVVTVLEEHSDKLLADTLAALQANRAKLKTLEIASTLQWQDWDQTTGQWVDSVGRLEGTAWIESAEPRRARFDVTLHRSEWINGAAPFVEENYMEVWDGKELRRLWRLPLSAPRGDMGIRDQLMGRQLLGDVFSSQLMYSEGFDIQGKHYDGSYTLAPEQLKNYTLSARRLLVGQKQNAIELLAKLPLPTLTETWGYWFDPNRGYALLRYWQTVDQETPFTESIIDDLTEAAPGVFYPSRAHLVIRDRHGPPRMQILFTADHVAANQPPPADTFHLDFPSEIRISPIASQPASSPTSSPATRNQ